MSETRDRRQRRWYQRHGDNGECIDCVESKDEALLHQQEEAHINKRARSFNPIIESRQVEGFMETKEPPADDYTDHVTLLRDKL